MSDVKYKYIQNTHNAPITCHIRDNKGVMVSTKKFMPALTEKFSGKVLHTGYERLTEEEYENLCKTSRTFQVYSGMTDKAKLLVVHDDLPADAKTPHEALVDAKKDARKAAAKIAELENKVVALKAELLDAQNKYKELFSASIDAEKLRLLNDKIIALEADKAALQAEVKKGAEPFEAKITELQKAIEEHRPPEDKTAVLQPVLNKLDEISEVFASKTLELAGKDKRVRELVNAFRKERKDLLTFEESKGSE